MPGGMPGNVEQGFLLEALGNKLTNATAPELGALQQLIEDTSNSLSYLARNKLDGIRDVDRDHLQRHWFDPRSGSCWWIEHQPIDPVVRAALIQVIKLRLDALGQGKDLPVVCYWICVGHEFEVVSCQSESQITFMLMTPSMPAPKRLEEPLDDSNYQYGAAEDIYIAKHPDTSPGETDVDGKPDDRRAVVTRPRRLLPKP